MKGLVVTGIVVASTLILSGGNVAASSSGGTSPSVFTMVLNLLLGNDPTTPVAAGQPNQSCQSFNPPQTPGNSAGGAPGSPFGGGVSDSHYAGSAPQNSNNPASVSQYDVACLNQFNKNSR
ncbi:MAG TPA: hypothetical protein VEU06_01515 [Micropepsaceae bacterium]|nr:hypothetical protein [Micropepsaceae bacterium]